MKPFLYVFSFCFIRYEVGTSNPFYIVLVFVLYVTRWVCMPFYPIPKHREEVHLSHILKKIHPLQTKFKCK